MPHQQLVLVLQRLSSISGHIQRDRYCNTEPLLQVLPRGLCPPQRPEEKKKQAKSLGCQIQKSKISLPPSKKKKKALRKSITLKKDRIREVSKENSLGKHAGRELNTPGPQLAGKESGQRILYLWLARSTAAKTQGRGSPGVGTVLCTRGLP